MKVGKLYKSMCDGMVVKCTTASYFGLFGGVVVDRGRSQHWVGFDYSRWACDSFEEYIPIQILTNGHTYNIPEGCKAEIKDGVITIEDDIEHFKVQFLISKNIIYIRKYPDRQINVYVYSNGNMKMSYNKIDAGDKCTEQEFIEAYNAALKKIQL